MPNPFLKLLGKEIGFDLGTSNSLVYVKGRGIVVNEPTMVAINRRTNQVVAVGTEAKKMHGRSPAHIDVIRPLTNGVISDFEMTQEILKYLMAKLNENKIGFYRGVIGVPTNVTEVERKSVEDVLHGVGIVQVLVVEEPIAAALGAKLPIEEPGSNMIIDIGGGTSEIAIISMGGIVVAKSLKVAGDRFNQDILSFIQDEFKLLIGEPTAEEIKMTIGSAVPLSEKLEMNIRGRDLSTGLPREIIIKDSHIRSALARSLKVIVEGIREVIETAPAELVGDILNRGIYLCGGGGVLRGMDKLVSGTIGVRSMIVDDPLTTVARGTGVIIEDWKRYADLLVNPSRPREIKL